MTEQKEIKLGAILQYLQMGLSILITFIYTPIMLKYLGKAEHGIYSLSGSFISYLSLLTLGFSGSYLHFYSKYKAENNEEGVSKLNGLYLITFTIMGLLALLFGFFMTTDLFMKSVFDSGLTNEEYELAKNLMIILIINMAVSFPASVFVSYITSQQKFVFQKITNMLKTVLSPALNIPLLLLGYRSLALVLVTFFVAILTDLINVYFCFGKLHMRFVFRNFDKRLFSNIFTFSLFIAINQIIDQVNWSTDKMIITRYKGAGEVSVYAIGASINAMYLSFSTAISNVFAPRVNRIVAEKKEGWNEQLNLLFRKVGRIQFFILALILTGFIFFGKYFIRIWAGDGGTGYDDSYYIALILMIPVTIPLCQNIGIEIQRAENKHQFRSLVYLGVAVMNVVVTIFLTQLWGGIGASLGTAISLVVGNIVIMNLFYHFVLKIDMLKFWLEILKILPSLIVPCVCGTFMMIFYEFQGLWDFFLLVVAYVIVFAVCVRFIGFNKYEKNSIQKVFGTFTKSKATVKKDLNSNGTVDDSTPPVTTTAQAEETIKGLEHVGDNKRNYSLDLAKILACVGVVVIHLIQYQGAMSNTMFYSLMGFVNPLFFIINGYLILSKKTITWKYSLLKALSIILFISLWVVPFEIINLVYSRNVLNVLKDIPKMVMVSGNFFHFWFLIALVILYLFLPLIKKVQESKVLSIIFLSACLLIGLGINVVDLSFRENILSIIPATARIHIYGFYFLIGGLIAKYGVQIRNKISLKLNVIFVIAFMTLSSGYLFFLNYYYIPGFGLFQLDPFTCIFSVCVFFLFWRLKIKSAKLTKFIKIVSSGTLGVYVLHPFISGLFLLICKKIGVANDWWLHYIDFVSVLIIAFLISIVGAMIPFIKTWFTLTRFEKLKNTDSSDVKVSS